MFVAFYACFLFALAATCSSCVPPYPLGLDDPVLEFSPPTIYRDWYDEAIACSGIDSHDRPFWRLRWFLATDLFDPENHDRHYAGFFRSPNKIYLTHLSYFSESTVKHEMMHYFGYSHDDPILYECSTP
jgi:hypothetical protein